MDLAALRSTFRSLADDAVTPYLWSDTDVDGYANAAVNDAVERGFLIEDDDHASAVVATTTAGVTGITAEVQTITIDATAGTFTVTYDGQTTSALAFNVSAAAMKSALEALSNLVPGNVTVTLASAVYTLTFANSLGDVAEVTVDATLLINQIVDIAITAGRAIYPLDARVLKITRAWLAVQDVYLGLTSKDSLDSGDSDLYGEYWNGTYFSRGFPYRNPSFEGTSGIPFKLVETTGSVQLIYAPATADTLRLTVRRLPLADLSDPAHIPEIRTERHIDLLDGMLARAYLKNDIDTRDEKKSAEHEALFTRSFGPRLDAQAKQHQRAPRNRTTRISAL